MKISIIKFGLFVLIALHQLTILKGQTIVINEFMSNNETTLKDDEDNFSDWIELYNTSDQPINIKNYGLSDRQNNPFKWIFPEIKIPAKGFLLVFASGKDRIDFNNLHTNFKISSNGEELFLTNSDGVIIDKTISKALSIDEVYERIPDGSTNWSKSFFATPGATNMIYQNNLRFSHSGGFYKYPFLLKINSFSGDTIHYTLDGSLPTSISNIFSDSLLITSNTKTNNYFSEIPTTPSQNLISYKAWESPDSLLDKAIIFRCASFKNNSRTSKFYTSSFFIDKKIFTKYSIPVISLVTEEKNLFDYEAGIYIPGKFYDNKDPEWSGNYFQRGKDWERPVHIEYFNSKGKPEFSQDAGVRINGGKTRQAAQKSLKLYARNEYKKKYFNYKLIPNRNTKNFKRFILRTSMGAWGGQTIIKDILAHEISRELNIEIQDFQPVILYINGEYWGIQTIRDRIDKWYIEYLYNIDHDSIEFFDWTNSHYFDLENFIRDNDLSNKKNYDYVNSQMDIDNFIDYLIAEMFFRNIDWPPNNRKLWRPLVKSGKWRWVFYDLDGGYGDYKYNMFRHLEKEYPEHSTTLFFKQLIKNDQFKTQFIDRYAYVLNNIFTEQKMVQKLDSLKSLYEMEINNHIARWHYPDSFFKWENDINEDLKKFIRNRPCFIEKNIIEYFDLSQFDFKCTSRNKSIYKSTIYLYPNPTIGVINIFNNSTLETSGEIQIINISGKVVHKENNVIIKPGSKKQLSVYNLPNGVYILKYIGLNIAKQFKFVLVN